MTQDIYVCPNCGLNGEETLIEEYGNYLAGVDKLGDNTWTDMEPTHYYCTECSTEFKELITENEWKALNRDKKIDSILND